MYINDQFIGWWAKYLLKKVSIEYWYGRFGLGPKIVLIRTLGHLLYDFHENDNPYIWY